ncbi:MAG: DNA polymerase III subunit delta' [Actinomycetota bacterium]
MNRAAPRAHEGSPARDARAGVWDPIVGHEAAVESLRRMVSARRVPHALLFAGPSGTGRGTVATALAAALNCAADGCGGCESCAKVARGVHPDVHVIEPEGEQLLVEEVRAVREEAFRSRHEGRAKIFIVREADRMNATAANALLKVLEEPPADVVFVLLASSPEDLLPTVRSRCRSIDFHDASPAEVRRALVDRYGVAEEQAVWAVAAAQGRLGRAVALATDAGTAERRMSHLRIPAALAAGDAASALEAATGLLAEAEDSAAGLRDRHREQIQVIEDSLGGSRGSATFVRRAERRQKRELRRAQRDALDEALVDLAGWYRDILLVQSGTGGDLVNPDMADALAREAEGMPVRAVLGAIACLEEARARLVRGAQALLAVEAALLGIQAAMAGTTTPGRLGRQ